MSRRSLLLAVPVLALTLALGVLIGAIFQPVGGSSARAGSAAPAAGSSGAAAQAATPTTGGSGSPRTVNVGGEGRVAVKPDLAYAVFGVDTANASLAQAQAENNQRMSAVLDKLKARGLQDRDLQTTGFSVSPQYDRDGRPNGYRVSNGVRATVRDLSSLGPIIEETVAAGATPGDARKWWLGDLARRANEAGVELTDLAVTPAQVAELTALIADGTINDKLARQVVDGVLAGEGDPKAVVVARGLAVMGESDELVAAVEAAIAGAPDVVEKVRGGKVAALGALVGQVMKATRGKADAPTVKRMLEERLL
jgi:uncharacterized protein YggE